MAQPASQAFVVFAWLAAFLLAAFPPFAASATVSGYAFDFFTLDPLNNVVVEVDTVPPQTIVAKQGFYSLELQPGNYTLKAKVISDGNTTYSTQELLQVVSEEGNYSVDLLLEPEGVFDFDIPDDSEIETTGPTATLPAATIVAPVAGQKEDDTGIYALVLVVVLVIVGLAYAFYKVSRLQRRVSETARREKSLEKSLEKQIADSIKPIEEAKKPEEGKALQQASASETHKALAIPVHEAPAIKMPEMHEPKLGITVTKAHELPKAELEKEEREVVQLLKQNEGRMQQRELRRLLKWSEAKLSNVTDDLEEKRVLKKIKRGRGNILRLVGAKED